MLSIVVLHYGANQVDMTATCLEKIARATEGDFEALLWINGEFWETYNAPLRSRKEQIYGTDERLSLARAYNMAASLASGDLVAVLHNDCMVTEGWNVALQAEAERGNIAFPRVETNEALVAARGVVRTPEWMPPSCCFVLKREALIKLGGWDQDFEFCHYEDMDLFKRATEAGMRLVECDSDVFHIRAVTRADQVDLANAALKANEKVYARKHGAREGDKWVFRFPSLERSMEHD